MPSEPLAQLSLGRHCLRSSLLRLLSWTRICVSCDLPLTPGRSTVRRSRSRGSAASTKGAVSASPLDPPLWGPALLVGVGDGLGVELDPRSHRRADRHALEVGPLCRRG